MHGRLSNLVTENFEKLDDSYDAAGSGQHIELSNLAHHMRTAHKQEDVSLPTSPSGNELQEIYQFTLKKQGSKSGRQSKRS
jgi:hypothetical protein